MKIWGECIGQSKVPICPRVGFERFGRRLHENPSSLNDHSRRRPVQKKIHWRGLQKPSNLPEELTRPVELWVWEIYLCFFSLQLSFPETQQQHFSKCYAFAPAITQQLVGVQCFLDILLLWVFTNDKFQDTSNYRDVRRLQRIATKND